MNLFFKSAICAAILAAICLVPVTGRLLAVNAQAAAPQEAAVETEATVQAPAGAIPHDMEGGKHLLQWGVFLYAAGEVAGLIGMGISHSRRAQRREAQSRERRIAADAGVLLLYSEYKAALTSGAAA